MKLTAIARLLLITLILIKGSQAQPLAFPSAEGFGKFTVGGRYGQVYLVTNLNNSGTGSLRAAVEATNVRVVVFQVSGRIRLTSPLIIRYPNITIAGQTSPDGICVSGASFLIKAGNVIIRNVRFRPGFDAGETAHAIQIFEPANNVIIDHCSFSWTRDAIVATWNPVSNLTIQNCIVSEVLNDHAVNLGAGLKDGQMRHLTRSSFIRNYIAHSLHRNPKVHYQTEVINNFVYNWDNIAVDCQENAQMDFIGNVYRRGPSSSQIKTVILAEPLPALRIFAQDNSTFENPNAGGDPWLSVDGDRQYQATRRINSSGYVPLPSSRVVDYINANVGAIPRDAVDERVLADASRNGGRIIGHESEVGGFPNYTGRTRTLAEWNALVARFGGVERAINSFLDSEIRLPNSGE